MHQLRCHMAFIGIDVGSSSVRGGLFDPQGALLAHAKRAFRVWNPESEFYELSSQDIWEATCGVIRELSGSLSGTQHVAGIGFDATCSLVVLDRKTLRGKSVSSSGDPARDIIMWMDHRAHEETSAVNATRHRLLDFVGGGVSIEMQVPKILWLKKTFGEEYIRSSYFFDLVDFLTFKCTGNMTRSLCTVTCKWLFDGEAKSFDGDLFRSLGLGALSEENFAAVGNSFAAPGTALSPGLTPDVAEVFGLQAHCPVASGLIDAYAGMLGSLFCKGSDSNPQSKMVLIAGTSACHMVSCDTRVFVKGVWGPFLSALLPNNWVLEGGQSAVASLLDHISQLFNCPSLPTIGAELEKLREARSLKDVGLLTEEVHVLPDFHGNRSPMADPQMRGMISGLRLSSSAQDSCLIYLATAQALAYGTRHIVEAIEQAMGRPLEAVLLCGGLRHNEVLVHCLADALSRPLLLPRQEEGVLLGAAMLGKMAAGGRSLQEVAGEMAGESLVVNPNAATKRFHDRKYQVFKEMLKCQQETRRIMRGADPSEM